MLKPSLKEKMWKEFKRLGADGLKYNHYALAASTEITNPDAWKEFLMENDVNDYINQETQILQGAEFRSILLNTTKDNSVGRAQLINAMLSVSQKNNKKEGPVVIYSYVPLNAQQAKSEHIQNENGDIFRR